MRHRGLFRLILLVGLPIVLYGQGIEFAVRGGVSNGGAWGGPYFGYYGPYMFSVGMAPTVGGALSYNVDPHISAGIDVDYWWKKAQYTYASYYSITWDFSDLAFSGFAKYNFMPQSSFQLLAGAGVSMHVPRMSITYQVLGQQYTYGGSSSYVGFDLLGEGSNWISDNMRVFLQVKYMYYTYLNGASFTIGVAWGRRPDEYGSDAYY